MKSFKMTIPVRPVGKARPRVTKSGHAYTPDKTQLAEDNIKIYLRAHNAHRFDGPLEVALKFSFKKPKSAPADRTFPSVKPDIDNLVKLVLDSSNGILWNDDAQVVDLHVYKRYSLHDFITIEVREKTNGK